ncbi:hypothetical protein QFZ70_001530 [Arthrobacter sp. V1I9]|uniref:hypothetical protein n=1 Tax=Arthrobacter sp. V1I9 TaxID=3042275 RepID=UPI0027930E74|nr:hypothetical protein [Arthrobacter sp. V1I9]MDQ0869057.1 hypothetical protein [Arthrobacter sp. V1I9]
MSVMDQLPEQKPVALLKEVDQLTREIKSRQTRSSASVINFRVYSADAYDLIVPGAFAKNAVLIEFIPDNMQFGGALCYRLYVSVTLGAAPPYIDNYGLQRLTVVNRRQQWIYNISTFPEAKLKFYFFAQASGTFTANLI